MTQAIGVFNFAESYRRAGKALLKGYNGGTHSRSPISFLFFQSCELYLKSYLWDALGESELRKIGHRLNKLHKEARQQGLVGTPWADYAMENIDVNIAISERYLRTGFYPNQMKIEAWSYLSAELCVATIGTLAFEHPILLQTIKPETLLDAEEFNLPEELGGPVSPERKAMAELERILSEEDLY